MSLEICTSTRWRRSAGRRSSRLYANGTPFEPVIVDLADPASSAAFRAVWPMAKMPASRDTAREHTVAESTIVIDYLDAHYPGYNPTSSN